MSNQWEEARSVKVEKSSTSTAETGRFASPCERLELQASLLYFSDVFPCLSVVSVLVSRSQELKN